MNELQKRAKYHRKRQKGMSPFYSPDGGSCILPDYGNSTSISTFNNSTSGSAPTSGMAEDYLQKPFNDDGSQLSRQELLNRIKCWYPHFNEYLRNGTKKSKEQLYMIYNNINEKEKQKIKQFEIENDPRTYQKKQPGVVINDPLYNFEDNEREGEYEVQSSTISLKEELNKLDHESYENAHYCSDLVSMYEGIEDRLSAQDKNELRKLINSTNDADTIAAFLAAKKSQDEDMEDPLSNQTPLCEDDYPCDDDDNWFYYKKSSDENDDAIDEDYQKMDDDWGDPYTTTEIERVLKKLTNNFTSEDGDLRTYYVQEKILAISVLKKYYNIVEVSDGRVDETSEPSWVISYADPKEDLNENLSMNEWYDSPEPDEDNADIFYEVYVVDPGEDISSVMPEVFHDEYEIGDAFDYAYAYALKQHNKGEKHVEIYRCYEDNIGVNRYLEETLYADSDLEEALHKPKSVLSMMKDDGSYKKIQNKILNILPEDSSDESIEITSTIDNGDGTYTVEFTVTYKQDGKTEELKREVLYSPETSTYLFYTDESLTEEGIQSISEFKDVWDEKILEASQRSLAAKITTINKALNIAPRGTEVYNGVNFYEAVGNKEFKKISEDNTSDDAIFSVHDIVRELIDNDRQGLLTIMNPEGLEEGYPNTIGDRYYRIDIKHVTDSDGFLTDYTWWYDDATGQNIFIFGDSELYTPGDTDPDWETDSEETAQEWWDNYVGPYDEEDFDESLYESYSDKDVKEFLDELGGYTDYDGKVEELMDYFGMTKDQAEIAIQDYVTSPNYDEFEENLNPINEDSIDDKPWDRLDSIHRILDVYDSANDKYQDHIVSEIARLAGFPDDSYVGSLDPDDYVWTKISDEKLRWLDAVTRLTNANKAKDECLNESQYSDLTEYSVVSYDGKRYSVHYNNVDNSPEADAQQLFNDFRATVSMISPYDDADYFWASIEKGTIKYIRDQKVVSKDFYFNADDAGIENDEWCEDIIMLAASKLAEKNATIKPRMVYESVDSNERLCESDTYDVKLGDEVQWRGKSYIVIDDENEYGSLTLRPTEMVDDDTFDGYGDSSEDIFLDRFQLEEYNLDKDPDYDDEEELYEDVNKDLSFIVEICDFDDELEPTDKLEEIVVTVPELVSKYGKTVLDTAMIGVTKQVVEKAGGIPNNWDISYLINNIASQKYHEQNPNTDFTTGDLIHVSDISLLPDSIKLLQKKLGKMLLPRYDDLDEAISDLSHPEQEFDSAATSINSNKLPAIYSMVNFNEGDVVIDFGGGKFDNAVEYIKDKGATLLVYDPYNRSAEHNQEVLSILEQNGGADAAVNSNVLNVIKEPEARKAVLQNIKQLTKPGAPIYITVYEGRGDGIEGPTKSGYQLNRKTADYMDEIQEVFPNAKRKGKLIVATN